ncbi:MAG: glycosyltransferase family 4 protein [Pirellulales bacterium]
MRILLIDSGLADDSQAAGPTSDLQSALHSAGQDVRTLWANQIPAGARPGPSAAPEQLAAYRQAWRAALDRIVDEFDPAVMQVRGLSPLTALALETGVPYIITVTADDLAEELSDPNQRRLIDQGVQNAAAIVANSPCAQRRLLAAFAEWPAAAMIYDPVAPPESNTACAPPWAGLNALEQLPLVLAAGDFADGQQMELLLNAAAAYEPLPAATILWGLGKRAGDWDWQIERLGLSRVSRIAPPLDRAARDALWERAAVVFASSPDGAGLRAAQEALCAGTPVIALAQGPLSELIDADVGAVVPPDDHEQLAETIGKFLEHGSTAPLRAACQRRAAERFSPAAAARRYLEHFQAASTHRGM